jgi:hypothetical protein
MADGENRAGAPRSREEMEKVAATAAHPVRMVLLNLLGTRPGSGAAELAEWSGEPIGRVRKQLKILADDGFIGVQRQENRRGVAKRYYAHVRAFSFTAEDEEELNEREVRHLNFGTLRLLFSATTEALAAGTLAARQNYVLGNTPGEVDARGWKELSDLHLDLLARTQDIVASSRARLEASGEQQTIRFTSGVLFFESPPLEKNPDD